MTVDERIFAQAELEAVPDIPETPPAIQETPVTAVDSLTETQARPWRYFIAGMGMTLLALVLGAVLGYLARPALDSAVYLAAAAPSIDSAAAINEAPVPVKAPVAATPPPEAPASLIGIVQTGGHSQGAPDAPVVIVEYSDFQCPYCGRHAREVEGQLNKVYVKGGQVRLVYKHLTILGDESVWAALASACAADQDKFWEYHDLIFARQAGENQGAFNPDKLKSWATELDLNTADFNECLDSQKHLDVVQANTLEAKQLGIRGTPGFFVNDTPLAGAESFEVFQQIIEEQLKTLAK